MNLPHKRLPVVRGSVLGPLLRGVDLTSLRMRAIIETLHNLWIRCTNRGVDFPLAAALEMLLEEDGVVSTDTTLLSFTLIPDMALCAGIALEAQDERRSTGVADALTLCFDGLLRSL